MIALPAERTKNSRPHDVPFSIQAQAVLREHRNESGEPLVRSGEGSFSGFSMAKETLDKASGVPDWTLHDCAARWQPAWPIWACSLMS